LILAITAAAAVAAAVPAVAQTVHQREYRQSERIAQGARTGQLTPNEAYLLRRREARLRRTEWLMRRRHHGYLTRHDRRRLRMMEQQANQRIHRLKHNRRRY
jgi:hypothetical protein